MTNPAAGWYPNPHDEMEWRYWDGATWTEHRAPRHATARTALPGTHSPRDAQGGPPGYAASHARNRGVLIVTGVAVAVLVLAFVGARSAGVGKKSQAYKDGYDIGRNYEDETGSHLSSAQECGDTASAMLMQGTYSSDDLPDWTKGCQDGYADLLKWYGGN